MIRFLAVLIVVAATLNASATETAFSYVGACMVYAKAKTLARMDLNLSKSAEVLYKNNGYSFEVEQVDSVYSDEGNRVEHSLNLRIMKNGKIVSWTLAEIGNSKNSGVILMTCNFPVISCSRAD